MKKMISAAIILIVAIILSGCSSDSEMRAKFGYGLHVFVHEASGDRYIVEHHLGDTYTITLLEKTQQ